MNLHEEILFTIYYINQLHIYLLDLYAQRLKDEDPRKDLRCNLCRRQNSGSLRSTNT